MTKEFELKSHKNIMLNKNKVNNLTTEIKGKQKKIIGRTEKNAFTLLELLVVILILGLLAGTVVPKIIGSATKAKVDLVCTSMAGAAQAIKMFKVDNGMYPETEEGFEALQTNPDPDKYSNYATTAYLEHLPTDSWGAKMVYLKVGNGFDIISYGADKREGGTDEYADIKYSQCHKDK